MCRITHCPGASRRTWAVAGKSQARMSLATVTFSNDSPKRRTLAAGSSTSAAILPIGYTFKIFVGPRMVVRRVGAHATDYVCADSRRLVAGSSALQLVDDLLWGKGLVARSSLDCWKDGEDLISSGHMGESVPVGLPRAAPLIRQPRDPSAGSAVVPLTAPQTRGVLVEDPDPGRRR